MTHPGARPTRVLFIHGLESGPRGGKVQLLREQGFEVVAPDMQMSLRKVWRTNSAARNLLRHKETRAMLAGVVAGGVLAARGHKVLAGGVVAGALGFGVLRRKQWTADALGHSLGACVALQREAISAARPDVVLGSSWGGAVAIELLVRGIWRGPTVLLAPAFHKVYERMDAEQIAPHAAYLSELSQQLPITLYHDPLDDVVPLAHSISLCEGSAIDLRVVNAGGHRLLELLERGELAQTLHAVHRLEA